jgi:alpha-ribazole phosphatase
MKMRLLLARHGLTDWNLQSRFQGQTDIPLNEQGCRQAAALGNRLASEPLQAIYTSDLRRAQQTAQAIRDGQLEAAPVRLEPGLREIRFGAWEGLTYAEIEQHDPEGLKNWQADIMHTAPPQGETLAELAARVEAVLHGLRSEASAGPALLVAHGGPLQVFLCLALGLPVQKYWQFHLQPASLSEICLYPQGAMLNLLNDTCHLANG